MGPIILGVLADLFINLAAGWFGAAIILPITVRQKYRPRALINNIEFGILALLISIVLRNKL